MERATLTKLCWDHAEYMFDGLVSIPIKELEKALVRKAGDHYNIWWVGESRSKSLIVREDPLKALDESWSDEAE